MCQQRAKLPGGLDFSYVCGLFILFTWLCLMLFLIKDYFCDCFRRMFPKTDGLRRLSHPQFDSTLPKYPPRLSHSSLRHSSIGSKSDEPVKQRRRLLSEQPPMRREQSVNKHRRLMSVQHRKRPRLGFLASPRQSRVGDEQQSSVQTSSSNIAISTISTRYYWFILLVLLLCFARNFDGKQAMIKPIVKTEPVDCSF